MTLDDFLNYGLTIASKGQEDLVRKLDGIFQNYSSFSVQKVSENGMFKKGEALDGSVAKETSPADLKSEKKKKELMVEERCAAYWTTLAPNVEDYSWKSARLIAAGSGKLIKGILWCGDVTVERLKWGNEVMKKRVSPGSKTEIDHKTFTRIRRVKRVTKMTEKVADGVLSEVVKVSEFFTSSVVNSKVGKKFFSLLPGQIVLASLDGFSKVCDAVEVAGKNVMSTTATVTTELVTHRERRGKKQVRQQEKGLMLLAMLLALHGLLLRSRKLLLRSRKTFKPKSVVKPTTLAQSAAKTAAAEDGEEKFDYCERGKFPRRLNSANPGLGNLLDPPGIGFAPTSLSKAPAMASRDPVQKTPLYPEVIQSNPDAPSNPKAPSSSSSSNLYPSIDMRDLVENLFPDPGEEPQNPSPNDHQSFPSAPPEATQEVLIKIPGAILNLIDEHYSVELACGDLTVVRLRQGDSVVAVLARVGDEIQWPLAKDEVSVKLDDSHYFFSFRAPKEHGSGSDSSDEEEKGDRNDSDDLLNYGLTIASKGQENLVRKLDGIFQNYSSFSVQKVSENGMFKKGEALDGSVAKETSPADLKSEKKKKEQMEERCAAYWTTLAPNVEDYSGKSARLIAAGSGQLIKGILWCGDVTVERLKWGNEVMKKRMSPGSKKEIDPKTLKRIRRAKRVTKMSQKVANGVLSGVVRVAGFFTSSVANSKAGKKFFSLLPGEIVLASLDGFSKVCDAVEVAGKNVMSTSATVTTELVTHRNGEEAGQATSEGLDAAGHAIGTAWAAFKIRKAFNPKSVLKPTTLAKSAAKAAAAEKKAKKKS
ncbi:Spartin [Morella rubra]|uniref:Spartin n=1 Tax=Morella rubra TaxID=262757 RepID=A0A6A1UPU3_9ROSI|nr:Spartin [Morella rubra]